MNTQEGRPSWHESAYSDNIPEMQSPSFWNKVKTVAGELVGFAQKSETTKVDFFMQMPARDADIQQQEAFERKFVPPIAGE